MKKTILFAAVMILVGANTHAFRGECGMGQGTGLSYHWASSLNLTDDQNAQIQAKQEAFMEEINPLRDRLFSRKMEVRELWRQASPDQAKISAKQREIQDIQSQIQARATQYQLECRELLSPEQQERLGTSVAHRGNWGGPGGRRYGW